GAAHAQLVCYLSRPESLLVVKEREPFLRWGPPPGGRALRALPAGPPGRASLRRRGLRSAARPPWCRGRSGRTEGTTPLIPVLAVSQFFPGLIIEDEEFLPRLVHAHCHHSEALEVLLLTVSGHAVVVLLCPFRMQFGPARDALRHKPSFARENTLRVGKRRRLGACSCLNCSCRSGTNAVGPSAKG